MLLWHIMKDVFLRPVIKTHDYFITGRCIHANFNAQLIKFIFSMIDTYASIKRYAQFLFKWFLKCALDHFASDWQNMKWFSGGSIKTKYNTSLFLNCVIFCDWSSKYMIISQINKIHFFPTDLINSWLFC